MRATHYDRYDLNLLLVFEALMEERNVSTAASSIGLTQPTFSHALNRLRKMCGDPLFVRTAKGMQPTAAAEAMAEPIRQALTLIRGSLLQKQSFDPAHGSRLFKLLLTDIGTVTFLPRLIRHLQEHAPSVSIETSQIAQDEYKDALQNGTVDLAIGQMPPLVAGFFQQRIFEDEFVCVVGAHHPRIKSAPTVEAYLHEKHVRVSVPGRQSSAVDQALNDQDRLRTVMVTVPQYLAILPILATSELVATVPFRVFLAMRRSDELRMFALPFAVPPVVVRQFWHERSHGDPGLVWLRSTISELFSTSSVVPPKASALQLNQA
jgi:DNA-binding transcriptional LysR family regulator